MFCFHVWVIALNHLCVAESGAPCVGDATGNMVRTTEASPRRDCSCEGSMDRDVLRSYDVDFGRAEGSLPGRLIGAIR